jgi:hypothetical protein
VSAVGGVVLTGSLPRCLKEQRGGHEVDLVAGCFCEIHNNSANGVSRASSRDASPKVTTIRETTHHSRKIHTPLIRQFGNDCDQNVAGHAYLHQTLVKFSIGEFTRK